MNEVECRGGGRIKFKCEVLRKVPGRKRMCLPLKTQNLQTTSQKYDVVITLLLYRPAGQIKFRLIQTQTTRQID